METLFIGIAVVLCIIFAAKICINLCALFMVYIFPLLVWAFMGSFGFWLILYIFGVKEILGCSTIIIGAIIGLIIGIWINYFSDSNRGGGSGNSDYSDDYSGDSHKTSDDIYDALKNR